MGHPLPKSYVGVPDMPKGVGWLAAIMAAHVVLIPFNGLFAILGHPFNAVAVAINIVGLFFMVRWYRELIQRRAEIRKRRFEVYLDREVPELEPPVDWGAFEAKLESELEGDAWKSLTKDRVYSLIPGNEPARDRMMQNMRDHLDEEFQKEISGIECDKATLSGPPPLLESCPHEFIYGEPLCLHCGGKYPDLCGPQRRRPVERILGYEPPLCDF